MRSLIHVVVGSNTKIVIRSTLLHQMNESADPPGSLSDCSLVANGLTLSLTSSRCAKASSLAVPLALYMPDALRTILEKWNSFCLSEYPAISAWVSRYLRYTPILIV